MRGSPRASFAPGGFKRGPAAITPYAPAMSKRARLIAAVSQIFNSALGISSATTRPMAPEMSKNVWAMLAIWMKGISASRGERPTSGAHSATAGAPTKVAVPKESTELSKAPKTWTRHSAVWRLLGKPRRRPKIRSRTPESAMPLKTTSMPCSATLPGLASPATACCPEMMPPRPRKMELAKRTCSHRQPREIASDVRTKVFATTSAFHGGTNLHSGVQILNNWRVGASAPEVATATATVAVAERATTVTTPKLPQNSVK
mmetsp:Transcript_51935/g.151318  ORF Transcript_51935/g.151318 Transcript_51935/m.151318 type:complete len:260 (-) Transcript_51935:292-1071(-)